MGVETSVGGRRLSDESAEETRARRAWEIIRGAMLEIKALYPNAQEQPRFWSPLADSCATAARAWASETAIAKARR